MPTHYAPEPYILWLTGAGVLIALALAATTGEPWMSKWLAHNVLWEIGSGIAGGWLVGRLFGWLATIEAGYPCCRGD